MRTINYEQKLNDKVQEALLVMTDRDRLFNETEALSVRLGKILVELQALYYRMVGKKTGFTKWASEKFERAPATIEHYLSYGRSPAKFAKENLRKGRHYHSTKVSVRTAVPPLEKLQEAFSKLPRIEQLEFIEWAQAEVDAAEALQIVTVPRARNPRHTIEQANA